MEIIFLLVSIGIRNRNQTKFTKNIEIFSPVPNFRGRAMRGLENFEFSIKWEGGHNEVQMVVFLGNQYRKKRTNWTIWDKNF